MVMVIDKLIEQIMAKRNPCIVGIDPEWSKIPECYKIEETTKTEAIKKWAEDVIDAVADIVPAVKPQMAFFEVFGSSGVAVFEHIVGYAHEKGLLLVDDSKRNDIGNTASAYAFAHLSKNGPINADFLTVSPFLGTDSLLPFIDLSASEGKGLFVLVKTSNPSSVEISEAIQSDGNTVREWLADYVHSTGNDMCGKYGYSSVGAVVGATFPKEAEQLRKKMKNNYFLVPGFGAQGGGAKDIVACFNEDGLGAVVNSSRGVIYHHLKVTAYDGTRERYLEIVREQAVKMQREIYAALKERYGEMKY